MSRLQSVFPHRPRQMAEPPIRKKKQAKINAGNIDINPMLSVPIELRLTIDKNEKDEYISHFKQCIFKGNDYNNPILKDISKTYVDETDQGNLSLLRMNTEKECNLRVMVCITVYNEPASQMQATLGAIKRNLENFTSKCGISSQEVAVVTIYDGISHINNDPKDEESNQLKMFKIFDLENNIKGDNTMQRQYEIYNLHLKFSKMNINKLLDTSDTSLMKLDPMVQKKYEKIEQQYIIDNIDQQDVKEKFEQLVSPQTQMLWKQTQQNIDEVFKNSTFETKQIDQIYIHMHIFKNIFLHNKKNNREEDLQFYQNIYKLLFMGSTQQFEDSLVFEQGRDNDGQVYIDFKNTFYNMEQRDLEMNYSMEKEYITIFKSILDEFLQNICDHIIEQINQKNLTDLDQEITLQYNQFQQNLAVCNILQKQQIKLDFVQRIYRYQDTFNLSNVMETNLNKGSKIEIQNKIFLTEDYMQEQLKVIYNRNLSQSTCLQKEKFVNMNQNKELYLLYKHLQQKFLQYLDEEYDDNMNNYNLIYKLFQNLDFVDQKSLNKTIQKFVKGELQLEGIGLAQRLKKDIIENQDIFNFGQINKLHQNILQRYNIYKNKKYIKDIKNEFNLTDQDKRGWQIEATKQQINESKKYIKSKANNAWVYQIRDKIYTKEEVEEKNNSNTNWCYNEDTEGEESDEENLVSQAQEEQKEPTKEEEHTYIEDQIREQLGKDYLNLFFCVKYANGKKLNSHLWFFRGFCEILKPDFIMLIDCGLTPDDDALYKFFQNMEVDKNIGGVCGFMGLKPEAQRDEAGQRIDGFKPEKVDFVSASFHQIFDIQKAQVFEYNFAHIIDKAFESVTGFIHVLPGAFSAYRYAALDYYLDKDGKRISILDNYLKLELDKKYKIQDLEIANMFLAEDRILCLSLFCHNKYRFTLKYVCNAHAFVDPAQNLTVMLGQRRRWINGSWFALNNVLKTYAVDVQKSKHSCFSKYIKLKGSMLYARIGQLQTYLALTFYFVAMQMQFSQSFADVLVPQPNQFASNLSTSAMGVYSFLLFFYFMLVGAMIFYSLQYNHNHPKAYKIYYGISTALGVYMWTSFVFMIMNVYEAIFLEEQNVDDPLFSSNEAKLIQYAIFIVLGAHTVPLLLNPCHRWGKILELLKALPAFLFYMPTYIHLLIIFAFCRIDDLSWGTKDAGQSSESKKKDEEFQLKVKEEKFKFFFKWIVWNMLISFLLIFGTSIGNNPSDTRKDVKKWIILGLLAFLVVMICFRFFFSTIYYIKDFFFRHFYIKLFFKKNVQQYAEKSQQIQNQMLEVIMKPFFDNYEKQQQFELQQLEQANQVEEQQGIQDFKLQYLDKVSVINLGANNRQNNQNQEGNQPEPQVSKIVQQLIDEYNTSKIQKAKQIEAQTVHVQSIVSGKRNNSLIVQQLINDNSSNQGGSLIKQMSKQKPRRQNIIFEERKEDSNNINKLNNTDYKNMGINQLLNQGNINQQYQAQKQPYESLTNEEKIAQLTGQNLNQQTGFKGVDPNLILKNNKK